MQTVFRYQTRKTVFSYPEKKVHSIDGKTP